jgi:DNA-binding NarL/FixJ family response regulator
MAAHLQEGVDLQDGGHGPTPSTLGTLERRILQLMATGMNTGEVAERLRMPIEMIHACLQSSMTKLGARSRLEALIIAIRLGLIELRPE